MTQVAADDIHPGLAGAEFTNYDGRSQAYDEKGILVTAVDPASPAAQQGLRADDIIVTVNRERVESVKALEAAAEEQNLLILGIRRGDRDLLLQIR